MLTIIIGHTDYYENNMRCDEIGLIRWLVRSLHYKRPRICELNWFDVDLAALQEGQQSIDSALFLNGKPNVYVFGRCTKIVIWYFLGIVRSSSYVLIFFSLGIIIAKMNCIILFYYFSSF